MKTYDSQKKLKAAYKLLLTEQLSLHTFDHVRELVKDINPDLDDALAKASKTAKKAQKLVKEKYFSLAVEHLPEKTKEEKDRKKALLLLLRYRNKLRSEIKRVETELNNTNLDQSQVSGQATSISRIAARAKGPLGVVTGVAVVIVAGGFILSGRTRSTENNSSGSMIQVDPPSLVIGLDGKSVSQEDGEFRDQPLQYIIEEVTVEEFGDQLHWGVHVHKHNAETLATDTHIPAEGAQVTVSIGHQENLFVETVDSTAWAYIKTPIPKEDTSLYIENVSGNIPWQADDQAFWSNSPAAEFRLK